MENCFVPEKSLIEFILYYAYSLSFLLPYGCLHLILQIVGRASRAECSSVHEYVLRSHILKIIFGWLALVWYTRIERELRLVYKHRVQIHLLPWAQWYKSSHVKTECVKKCNNVSNIRHYHGHFIQVQHTFLAKSFSSQAGCKETRAPMHVSRGNCCMKIFKV